MKPGNLFLRNETRETQEVNSYKTEEVCTQRTHGLFNTTLRLTSCKLQWTAPVNHCSQLRKAPPVRQTPGPFLSSPYLTRFTDILSNYARRNTSKDTLTHRTSEQSGMEETCRDHLVQHPAMAQSPRARDTGASRSGLGISRKRTLQRDPFSSYRQGRGRASRPSP